MKQRVVSRLIAPLAAVSLLLLVTAGVSAWYARDVRRRVSEMLTNYVASVRAAQDLETGVREIDARLDRYLITGDRGHLDGLGTARAGVADALATAEALAFTREEQVRMARVRVGTDRLFAGLDEVTALPAGPDQIGRIAALASIPEREILTPAHEYRRLNEDMLARASTENEELALFCLGGAGMRSHHSWTHDRQRYFASTNLPPAPRRSSWPGTGNPRARTSGTDGRGARTGSSSRLRNLRGRKVRYYRQAG